MISTKKGKIPCGFSAAQHRSGNNPQLIKRQFPATELTQRCANPGFYQRWLDHSGTGQGNDPLGRQLSGKKEMADADHILIADLPDCFIFMYRIDEVNMGRRQSCRMRAGKRPVLDSIQLFTGQQGDWSRYSNGWEQLTSRRSDFQAKLILGLVLVDDDLRISGQWRGVRRGDK